jgi:hypothetical protein
LIISHVHRYVFVELPRTGSSAVRHELREMYDGVPILNKHSTYREFLRKATPDEREYFVFSAVRNPLDDAVSRYFKLRTDHHGRFSGQEAVQRRKHLVNNVLDAQMFRYLERTDADFSAFFLKFYRLPYDTWASLSHTQFDYVMRFERLADDFAMALQRAGIEPIRPLPVINPTTSRRREFASYYTPAARRRARRVMGPYMRRWGYEFPADWEIEPPSQVHQIEYSMFSALARAYWVHVRPRL